MEPRKTLLYLALKYEGNWDAMYKAICDREISDDENILKSVENCKEKYITILDDEYPEKLKNIFKPPFLLFYRGDISLINKYEDTLSVVGSRKCSSYGKSMTIDIVSKLAKQLVIVSGLAKGIDAIAHETALYEKGKTIAVLGCGFNNFYPNENLELFNKIQKYGLVITEYPNNTQCSPKHFPIRNRIIAGLSQYLLITDAKKYSGTSITATLTLQFGGEIMCVPTRANEQSLCNHLIASGAFLVESADDVLFIMNKYCHTPIF